MEVLLLFLILVGWLAFGVLGSWVASQKHRDPMEGLVLGGIFGPFGCLIEALMPIGEPPPRPAPLTPEEIARGEQRRREHEARKEEQAVRDRELRQIQAKAADREWREAQARRDKEWGRVKQELRAQLDVGREWFSRTIVRFGWFRVLPDTVQAVGLGLAVATPLVLATIWGLKRVLPQDEPVVVEIRKEPVVVDIPPPPSITNRDGTPF